MLETKQFSHSLIYDKIKDFCSFHGITEHEFKCFNSPSLIFEHMLIDNNKSELTSTFKINNYHTFHDIFLEYFLTSYSFKSKLMNIAEMYDNFFNTERHKSCYNIYNVYFINLDSEIQEAIVFSFEELDFGNPFTLVIEVNNSNIFDLEEQVFNYYKHTFSINNIPEDFVKLLSQMTEDEKTLLRMLLI